jgi:hypothetical protein
MRLIHGNARRALSPPRNDGGKAEKRNVPAAQIVEKQMSSRAPVRCSNNFVKHGAMDTSFDCSNAELSPSSSNGLILEGRGDALFGDASDGVACFTPVSEHPGGKNGECLLFNPTRACRFAAFLPEESRAESPQPVQVPDVQPIP